MAPGSGLPVVVSKSAGAVNIAEVHQSVALVTAKAVSSQVGWFSVLPPDLTSDSPLEWSPKLLLGLSLEPHLCLQPLEPTPGPEKATKDVRH